MIQKHIDQYCTSHTFFGRILKMTDRQAKVMTLLDDSGFALRAVLFKITLSEHVAGDLMQQLFIRLYESGGFSQSKDSFAYAWRAAVNLAFDWQRRQIREGRASAAARSVSSQIEWPQPTRVRYSSRSY